MQRQKHSSELTVKWAARLQDGSCVVESDELSWSNIQKQVNGLSLVSGSQTIISLPDGMSHYTQGKTGSCSLIGGKISIESRWIGFEISGGKSFKIRRMESNGIIKVEV
jgi:hypothetical protein